MCVNVRKAKFSGKTTVSDGRKILSKSQRLFNLQSLRYSYIKLRTFFFPFSFSKNNNLNFLPPSRVNNKLTLITVEKKFLSKL